MKVPDLRILQPFAQRFEGTMLTQLLGIGQVTP